MKYGLDDQCYDDLMQLFRLYPVGLSDSPKDGRPSKKARLSDEQVREIVKAAMQFEDQYMPIDTAVKRAISNNWPPEPGEKILEKYRKSEKRRQRAIPIHKPFAYDYKGKELKEALALTYLYDHDKRQGPPEGPTFCRTYSDLVDVYVDILTRFTLETDDGPKKIMDRILRTTLHRPENPSIAVELSEVIADIKDRTEEHIPLSEAFLERIMGSADYETILPNQLATLRGIYVYIPLDCPRSFRTKRIKDLVEEWKHRRAEAGYSFEPRERAQGMRNDLAGLAGRIDRLKKAVLRSHNDYGAPRSDNLAPHYSPGPASVTQHKQVLAEGLAKALREYFPKVCFDHNLLLEATATGVEYAMDSVKNTAPARRTWPTEIAREDTDESKPVS